MKNKINISRVNWNAKTTSIGAGRGILISIFIEIDNTNSIELRSTLESIINQEYKNVEVILSINKNLNLIFKDSQIESFYDLRGLHILEDYVSISEILEGKHESLYRGDLIFFINPGMVIEKHLFIDILNIIGDKNYSLNMPLIALIDWDVRNSDKNIIQPSIKAAWDQDLILKVNYLMDSLLFSRSLLHAIRETRTDIEVTSIYELLKKMVICKTSLKIVRINYPGVHFSKEYYEKYSRIINYIDNINLSASIIVINDNYDDYIGLIYYAINYSKIGYEIIIVTNTKITIKDFEKIDNYNIKILYNQDLTNISQMINYGVDHCTKDVLLIVSSRIKNLGRNKIEKLIRKASLPGIGTVGSKILYENSNIIFHNGALLNHATIYTYSMNGMTDMRVDNQINIQSIKSPIIPIHLFSLKRSLFHLVGGFNEIFLSRVYLDVDFCLKLKCQELDNICLQLRDIFYTIRPNEIEVSENIARSYILDKWENELN